MAAVNQVLFCVLVWTETQSKSMNTQKKKNKASFQSSWSIQDLLHDIENTIILRNTAG